MVDDTAGPAPLPRLLTAYARPGDRDAHRLGWAFDARLADVLRSTSEPMIGQMRLTWWHDVLSDAESAQGRGDPLADALRSMLAGGRPARPLLDMVEGWEMLLQPLPLSGPDLGVYADGRGGGLFRWLAGDCADSVEAIGAAGRAWALWDLAGHVSDTETAGRALVLGQRALAGMDMRDWPRRLKPLRLLVTLASDDLAQGRRPPPGFTAAQYRRLLRAAWLGR